MLGKTVEYEKKHMYDYWYEYTKPKYWYKANLCYTDRDSLIVHVKLEDSYAGFAGDVEKGFGTSNYEVDKPQTIGKNEKIIGAIKGELWERIRKEFATLRLNMYSYLTNKSHVDEMRKGTKKCVIKWDIQFEDYKTYLEIKKE